MDPATIDRLLEPTTNHLSLVLVASPRSVTWDSPTGQMISGSPALRESDRAESTPSPPWVSVSGKRRSPAKSAQARFLGTSAAPGSLAVHHFGRGYEVSTSWLPRMDSNSAVNRLTQPESSGRLPLAASRCFRLCTLPSPFGHRGFTPTGQTSESAAHMKTAREILSPLRGSSVARQETGAPGRPKRPEA